jgi:hypothetical protein
MSRVPVALQATGLFIYSEKLKKTLREKKEMKRGDQMEMEIRSASIWAVEVYSKFKP